MNENLNNNQKTIRLVIIHLANDYVADDNCLSC